MGIAFNVTILWAIFKDVGSYLSAKSDKRKDEIINARKEMNTAFIRTYDYLKVQKGEYLASPELAELWNQASAAVMKVDQSLGDMLYYKSRFWSDPQLFIGSNRDDEIIELNDVINEMERLRMRLN